VTLRAFRPEDLPELQRLDALCFPPQISYSRAELYYFVRHPRSTTIVAEIDPAFAQKQNYKQRIAGFCVTDWKMDRGRKLGHYITIDVAPELRRLGIGRTLMESAEAKFVELACIAITLEVAVDNHGAQTFYERMGYEQTGRIRCYYADKTDALVMRKPLSMVR
jgi:ribosomal-protein-alanine N-acetyltransferase